MKQSKSLFFVVILLVLMGCTGMKKNGYVPVNKNAIPEAVQLLDFLYSIQVFICSC